MVLIVNYVLNAREKEIDNWDHVWLCEYNEFTIREVIEPAIFEFKEILQEKGDPNDIEILRDCNIQFIQCLQEHSQRNEEDNLIIFNLWSYCYDQLKIKVWIKRCEEVTEIEQKKGISRMDKRKRKLQVKDREEEGDLGKKNKDNIIKNTSKINKKLKKDEEKLINLVTSDKALQNIIDNRTIKKS
ncbi:uncharacterized protein OCT59_023410 [Rhizophagus irregularis]|uniref:Uncharacterized protein n=2 Tax=Rhizophagus irregularis TaxID=588596 RepID=U9TAW4_RHIID|nr:hypothetical protein GLOIN_2v1771844 [Rhizophagus irregularis DAOM 181602=DAOM 197198]POG74043.1 hypothetical protein GLOIN_2v1771844 [Rhizophagus irregularis DAOM 181602=DAOM 197198]UZO02997.1 hypothetical protein OCT59_023410 [Rhizophagus irregularis]GBC20331.1 hypothetical protein GLOIN_2v1771844 [Rhizophagus irregularis DAOM 181602=DAOM 197198]|eukprot:XP_025180909.1 hypothetical protein GLOIN_2v1771844 [Rhizophagus irregularis DAOM 181602=DAOM 197198]